MVDGVVEEDVAVVATGLGVGVDDVGAVGGECKVVDAVAGVGGLVGGLEEEGGVGQ